MNIEEKLTGLCESVLAGAGLELVMVEVVGLPRRRTIRFFIDREGGVSVEDCARASRLLDPLIESSGVLNAAWVLEVSSPGLERPLVKPADFERFSGHKIKVKLKRPLESHRNLNGVLRGLDGQGWVQVELGNGELFNVPPGEIARANLVFEWK